MLRLLVGRDWTANRDEILRRIREDVRLKKGGRILMVPELISHDTERRLCAAAGDTASRFAEVLSFTRLARRVADSAGCAAEECLDDGGRVVAMAAAARQLSSRLKAYASVETKPEFLTGLIDAVDEFKRCCITSVDLLLASKSTEGSLAQKLEELSLLMEAYDALCSRGKRDPRDQEALLLEQLEENRFAQEHVFYIDGFPDFTRQHLAILEHLIRNCPEVTISMNCDAPGSGLLAFEKAGETARTLCTLAHRAQVEVRIEDLPVGEMPLNVVREKIFQGPIVEGSARGCLAAYRGESPYQECLAAANQILRLVQDGFRYRDITLVCTDMTVYQPLVNLVFHRMHIPVYQSGTEDILQKSVIATALNGLEAALSGFDQRSVLRYFRSALSPLNQDLCDEIENYAIIWDIRGQKWTQKWENHPEGLSGVWSDKVQEKLKKIGEAKDRAVLPLQQLRQGMLEAKNLQQQVKALYAFLVDIQLETKLYNLARELDNAGDNRSAQILNQLWEILVSSLEQMYDVLGETYWDSEHFTRLLRLLLSQYHVGTIPPVLDAVQMGPVNAMRCHQQKHLIILGAQDGSFPGYTGSSGVLTDQERVVLRELGVPLTGGAIEGIQAEFAEIYGVICGAMESITVYYSGDQPSFLFRRLAQIAGGTCDAVNDLGFAIAGPSEAGAWLAQWEDDTIAQRLDVLEAYKQISARKTYTLGKLERQQVEDLYGSTLNLSASQVDKQAECRFSYFLRYGIRVQERKEAKVDPAEFGTYVHAVLENTARCVMEMGGFQRVSLEETMQIARRFSDEYARERFAQIDSQRMAYMFMRNVKELDMIVRELWMELHESQFQPAAFELNFGGEEGLPAIAIRSGSMNAILRGFIDRMDIWNHAGNTYYRIVDYKTGKKDFDYCDVFNGVGLQMLLYLFALKNSNEDSLGTRPIPAGVQYFPARVPYLSSDGRLDDEEAEAVRDKEWKRKGLLLNDPDVLHAMESGDSPKRLCYTVKKDGSFSGDLADREQLKCLEQYVYQFLGSMVDEIASGNIEPNPYTRGTSHSACTFCPYGSICHKDDVPGRRNYKTMSAQRFWEEIGKEVEKHG